MVNLCRDILEEFASHCWVNHANHWLHLSQQATAQVEAIRDWRARNPNYDRKYHAANREKANAARRERHRRAKLK